MFHRLRFEIPLFVNENCSSCCVKEYLKQLNSELEKLAEMIHGDTVNEGRRRVFPWLCDAEFAGKQYFWISFGVKACLVCEFSSKIHPNIPNANIGRAGRLSIFFVLRLVAWDG